MLSKSIGAMAYALVLGVLVPAKLTFGQGQQQVKAELSGVIKDASGARVPRVTVTATHTATQFSREAQTNDNGFYVIGSLPVGEYVLTAELSGFRKYIQSGITLGGGDRKVVDVQLEIGEVTNEIEVTAAAPLVDRSDATLGVNLEEKTISTLPVNGRDFTALLKLQPGAVTGDAGAYPAGSVTGSANEAGENASISYNGAFDSWSSSSFTLDGVDVSQIQFGMLSANSVSIESISEVVVDTSNYSAENGRSAAGKINFISKTGSNNFHGSVFEFYRGTRFQANEFLLNSAGTKLKDFSRHQFGGSVGGPIVKDKLFFFVNYEGTRLDRPSSKTLNALTPEFKRTLAPSLRAYLDAVPAPTRISTVDPRVGTVVLQARNVNNNDIFLPRIDWNLGSHQIFGRWNRTRQSTSDGAATEGGFPQWPRVSKSEMDNVGITWNAVLSPTTTNAFGFGRQDFFSTSRTFDGFPAPACPACGKINTPFWYYEEIPGVLQVPNESSANFLNDNFRKLYGNHQVSTGFEFRRSISSQGRNDQPLYNFLTLDDLAANRPVTATNMWGFAPLAFGPSIQNDWGFYLQDDWKISPRLTLNLGVRYDFQTPIINSDAKPGRRPDWEGLRTGNILNCKICTPGNYLVPGTKAVDPVNDRFFTRPGERFRVGDYNNVAPRLGFALDLLGDGKTVLRGGYGIVYQLLEPHTFGGQRAAINVVPRAAIDRADDASLAFPVLDFSKARGALPPLTFIDPSMENGWTRQWNFSLQKALPRNSLLQLAYVGNRTRVLSIFNARYELNPFIPDATNSAGGQRADLCCAAIDMRSAPFHQSYHALQTTFKRSVAHGLVFNVFYTWAHAINEYNETQGSGFFFRKPDIAYADGPGSQFHRFEKSAGFADVRHNFLSQFLWELPLGNHAIARGWQISGIFDARTGIPFPVSSGRQNRYRGTSRANRVPGVSPYTGYVGPDRPYLNRDAFATPPADPLFPGRILLGQDEIRSVKGPGRWNTDLGLLKDVSITERQKVQLRAEIFNLFNHINWGHPRPGGLDTNLSSPRFGMMNTPASSSRQIQFGVRYIF